MWVTPSNNTYTEPLLRTNPHSQISSGEQTYSGQVCMQLSVSQSVGTHMSPPTHRPATSKLFTSGTRQPYGTCKRERGREECTTRHSADTSTTAVSNSISISEEGSRSSATVGDPKAQHQQSLRRTNLPDSSAPWWAG